MKQHNVEILVAYDRACLMSSFRSGVREAGNSISNSMIRSPFCAGCLDMGIPSPGTRFVYPGLKKKPDYFANHILAWLCFEVSEFCRCNWFNLESVQFQKTKRTMWCYQYRQAPVTRRTGIDSPYLMMSLMGTCMMRSSRVRTSTVQPVSARARDTRAR